MFSVEQAFVGRDEKRDLLKTPAWETKLQTLFHKAVVAKLELVTYKSGRMGSQTEL